MDNDLVKRLVWSGLVAGIGAAASWLSFRVSAAVWRQLFKEEPPV